MTFSRLVGIAAGAALIVVVGAPQRAEAGVIRFSTAACGGFSSCNDASFVAGAGVPLTFNDFNIAGSGSVAGNSFSPDFVLASLVSATFGGSNTANVQYSGSGASSEVGPDSNFDGILNVTFGVGQTAVGFGTVELGNNGVALERIRLYNGATLIGDFAAASTDIFNYEGFVTNAGDLITRVELEGNFFALQNIKYSSAAVPEPAMLSLLGLGFAAAMRRRARRS